MFKQSKFLFHSHSLTYYYNKETITGPNYPHLAMAILLAIFSPVIIWHNMVSVSNIMSTAQEELCCSSSVLVSKQRLNIFSQG